MTSSKTNHWKLGFFVTSGAILGLIALLWLGTAKFGGEITQCRAFFPESVTGLEVGSPVKLRGVTIGSVSRIGFAEDGRSVEVVLDGYVDVMRSLGLSEVGELPTHEHAGLDDIYAQLASAGITGAKYILVDFIEVNEELAFNEFSFHMDVDVIRTVPSSLESLEQLLLHAAQTMPKTLDDISATSGVIREIFEEIDIDRVKSELNTLIDNLQGTLDELRRGLNKLNDPEGSLTTVLNDISRLANELRDDADEADVGATAASFRAATDSFTDLAANSAGLGVEAARVLDDLRGTATELSATLRAVRHLAELLERDPGALLRGREAEPTGTP